MYSSEKPNTTWLPMPSPSCSSAALSTKVSLYLGSGGRKFWKRKIAVKAAELADLFALYKALESRVPRISPARTHSSHTSVGKSHGCFPKAENKRERAKEGSVLLQRLCLSGYGFVEALWSPRGTGCKEENESLGGKKKKKRLFFWFPAGTRAAWGSCLQRQSPFREAALMPQEETCCVHGSLPLQIFLLWF